MSKLLDDLDALNAHGVYVQDDRVVLIHPVTGPLTRAEALVLAAWLVRVADDHDDFGAILQRVSER